MSTVTNTAAAQALKGQCVVVTVSLTDAANVVANLQVGQACSVTGNTGRVAEIFSGGNTFRIAPNNFGTRFDTSGTPGILGAGTVITFN